MVIATRGLPVLALILIWWKRTTINPFIFGLTIDGMSLIYELIQMKVSGTDYLTDTMNYVDLLGLCASACWIIAYLKNSKIVRD